MNKMLVVRRSVGPHTGTTILIDNLLYCSTPLTHEEIMKLNPYRESTSKSTFCLEQHF